VAFTQTTAAESADALDTASVEYNTRRAGVASRTHDVLIDADMWLPKQTVNVGWEAAPTLATAPGCGAPYACVITSTPN